MSKWTNMRKQYIELEKKGIVGMVVCFLVGICCDWIVAREFIIIPIEDIASFSLTLLQIQATVGTLIFAIIALLTGNISESYMGVSISEYYLNIRPWKLKQQVNVVISLGLILLGVIFHVLKLYNVVFFLFVATLIDVLISITEIHSAFRGKHVENLEIEAYIDHVIEGEAGYDEKVNIYKNFVLDWKRCIDKQDRGTKEKYYEVFKKSFCALWKFEDEESLMDMQQQCYSMAYCLLGSEGDRMKESGIEFIQNVYDSLWLNILNYKYEKEKILKNKYKEGFFLFSEVHTDLINAIYDLRAEKVEKVLSLNSFLDSVQRIMIWLRNESNVVENKNSKYYYNNEIGNLCFFARQMGYYLSKQMQKNNYVEKRYWTMVLDRYTNFSAYNIPQERQEDFLLGKCKVYFSYCYGMLVNGLEDIVIQGLYLSGISNIHSLDNKYQALLYLMVHCYLYYLAERENEDCISEENRRFAQNVLYNKDVKKAYECFLSMLSEKEEWLDFDILKQMSETLDRYEFFPKYGSAKAMILEYVENDFYLFTMLYMSHEYYMPNLLEKNIDDMNAYRYVSQGNEEKTKETFLNLYKIINTQNKADEKISVEVGLMYDRLEKIVKRKQKERYIELAKKDQKEYEKKINEKEVCKKIREDVYKQIKETFSIILTDDDTKNGVIRINLLYLDHYTNSVGEKSLDGFYSDMQGAFLSGIENYLFRRKVVDLKNRFDDFSDDRDFMNYLKVNDMKILLGSKFILSNRNYRLSTEFKEFMEDYKTIYTSVVMEGIALKENAIQVCLHDVNVSIHAPNIKESSARYNEATGEYSYSIMEGLPVDFEEHELKEFLYNNRKVISVTAKVSIQVNEKNVGTIITGKRRI